MVITYFSKPVSNGAISKQSQKGVSYRFLGSVRSLIFLLVTFLTLSTSVQAAAPSAVADLIAFGEDAQAVLAWTAPSDGGSAITDYLVEYKLSTSGTWLTFSDGVSTNATATVTSLTNASLYNFRVSAINGDGTATASNTASATPMVLLVQDDFDSRTNGSIDGQNGWAINTGTTWTVGAGGSGKIVVSGTATYPTNYVVQGDPSWVNQRVKVDFLAGTTKPVIWLRKQDKSGTGDGYMLRRESSTWYIEKYISQGSGLVTLASAATPVTLTGGSWYTIDVSVIDNSDGNPVLTAYVYAQGGSRPATSFLTYTDTGENFTEGYVALGANGFATSFDNAAIYGTTEEGVRLISPAHRVAAAPNVATQAIIFENDKVSYIPYIQTSTTLTAKASVGSTVLPSGGGVKFTLNEGLATEQSSVDMIAPFSAAFTSLAKGTYTLDVDVVDSSQVVQVGDDYHDEVTGVGIGDIYTIIGDSITAGFYETDFGTTHFKTWLDAPEGSTSDDNRNYPQYHAVSGLQGYHLGYAKYLNDSLSSYVGYPVFFMNESLSGYAVATWQTKLDHFSLGVKIKNRLKKLQPNGLILPLGGNDALDTSAATFGTRYQTLIDTLNTTYTTIEDSKTYISIPVHSIPEPRASTLPTYVPIIEALITANDVKAGPDFLNFFYNNQGTYYFDLYHPNDAGFVQMGRLWNIVTIAPKNVAVSQSNTSAVLTWDDLTTYESSIAGYTVEYGTSPGVYTTTVDVGDVQTATVTGLSSGQTYYFAVSGYDDNANPAITATETQRSSEVSLAYDETAPTISAVSSTPSSTGATITWTTSIDASSRVEYGLTNTYGSTTAETDTSPRVSSHSVVLSGLTSCTTYHYRVHSKIATAVEATSSDATFTTGGCTEGGNTVPGAPTSVSAVAGANQAVVSFTAPVSDGGSAITLYTVTSTPESITATGTSSPITVTGLRSNTAYTFTVVATNIEGDSSSSDPSNAVTPTQRAISGSYTTGCLPSDPSTPDIEGPCLRTNNPPILPILVNPTPTPIFTYTRTLKFKMRGVDVKALQQALNTALRLPAPLGTDGIFGPNTLKAVQMFQKEKGLVPDGLFGPKSVKALNSI